MLAMNVSPLNAPLLTFSDAEEALSSWIRLARQFDEVQRSLEKQEKTLNALVEIVPASKLALIFTEDDESESRFSLADYAKHKAEGGPLPAKIVEEDAGFPATLVRIVKRSPAGLTHRQMMDEVLKTEFAEKVSTNESKRYYTAMGRLFKSRVLVKHGDRIYTEAIFKTLEQVPGALAPTTRFKAGSTTQQIIDILAQTPTGLSGAEVKEKLIEMDESNREKFKGAYVYNCLSRLAKNAAIVRKDSRYYPAQKATPRGNGASDATASGQAR